MEYDDRKKNVSDSFHIRISIFGAVNFTTGSTAHKRTPCQSKPFPTAVGKLQRFCDKRYHLQIKHVRANLGPRTDFTLNQRWTSITVRHEPSTRTREDFITVRREPSTRTREDFITVRREPSTRTREDFILQP